MRFAVISGGKVINVAEAPSGWSDPTQGSVTVASDTAQIGWTYDGKTFTAPASPALTVAQLVSLASARQNSLLANVWTFDVGTADLPLKLTTRLDDRGQASMTQLLVWSGFAGPSDTEPYSNVDSTPATITPSQAKSLGLMAGQAKASTYVAYNKVVAAITASPPAVTTADQVNTNTAWPSAS